MDILAGLGKLFSSDAFKNLLGGGLGIYQAFKAGDMMDFQKSMMKNNDKRAQGAYDDMQRDYDARHALDF